MKPHSAAALAVAALLLLPFSAFALDSSGAAQPEGPSSPPETSAPPAAPDLSGSPFLPGEQMIIIAAGLHIPAFLYTATGSGVGNLSLGGSFSFDYQYFVARGLSIGGNVAGAYNDTIGGLSIFTAPIGFTASYWWTKLPFEFSVLGEAGGYIMRYAVTPSKGMIDPFAKAGAGVYWRATPSWSLGLQAYLWFIPEIHYGDSANLWGYGGFVETSIGAVYHL